MPQDDTVDAHGMVGPADGDRFWYRPLRPLETVLDDLLVGTTTPARSFPGSERCAEEP